MQDFLGLDEDIRLNSTTFTWPKRMGPIFEVSQMRLDSQRGKAETELKRR